MATHPDDIDVILVHGYGWPRWSGGPMFYAEQLGLEALSRRLQALADELGDASFAPAPLLLDLVDSGQSLRSLARRVAWADYATLQHSINKCEQPHTIPNQHKKIGTKSNRKKV